MIILKTPEQIQIMREGGKILAGIMKELEKEIKPGIETRYLDKVALGLVFRYRAKPSFKGYMEFPACLCVSLNEEVVHGLPSDRKLKEGDIVSLDLGILFKGFHTDMAITLPVGKVKPETLKLIKTTKKALDIAIKKAKIGNTFGDIESAIQEFAEGKGYNVVRELCGHGIGKDLHEDPQVLNFGKKGIGPKLAEGMVFAIEPMLTMGDWRIKRAKDGYGFETKDQSLSAHFEHTIAITKSGHEILTKT